jgi:hypothetical protein
LITGNGVWDGTSAFSDSYLKLGPPTGITIPVLDYFTPYNQSNLDADDSDVGSSGTALLIDQTSGPIPHLLVGASKASEFYMLNRDNMGQYNASSDAVVQEFALNGHCFSTPGFWNNNLYYFGVNFGGTQPGQSFAFDPTTGMFATTAANATPSGFGFAGATPSISASSATTDGIVWAIDTGAYGTNDTAAAAAGPAILHAFDANNISTELWNSSQAAKGRDTAGNAVKFTVPTVANGKVYIGTRGSDNTMGGGTTFGAKRAGPICISGDGWGGGAWCKTRLSRRHGNLKSESRPLKGRLQVGRRRNGAGRMPAPPTATYLRSWGHRRLRGLPSQ